MAAALNTNGYGGVLPVSEWDKADKVVSLAWQSVTKFQKAIDDRWTSIGTPLSTYQAALETYKRAVATFASRLEQLKHGPVTAPDAVDKWRAFAVGLDSDIRSTIGDLDYTSIGNAAATVTAETISDVKEGAKMALGIGLPVIALVAVAVILLKVKR